MRVFLMRYAHHEGCSRPSHERRCLIAFELHQALAPGTLHDSLQGRHGVVMQAKR